MKRWSVRQLRREAERRFGIEQVRPGQQELIEAILLGQSALGILPTGAGKSLCYQLPALFLPKPVVVVSPLIALMEDPKDKLAEVNIEAAKLNSTLTSVQEHNTVHGILQRDHPLISCLLYRLEDKRIQSNFLSSKYPSRAGFNSPLRAADPA